MAIRAQTENAAAKRPKRPFFKTLVADLKKTTAFIKRVKLLHEETREAVINDFEKLNLSRYTGEVVSAIVDKKDV